VLWAKKFGGVQGQNGLRGITMDNSGYIYTMGSFTNTAVFDDITLVAGSSSNAHNTYVVKQDPLGDVIWATTLADTQSFNYVRPVSIVTDTQNNIYITGTFSNESITFGNFTLTRTTQEEKNNLFVVKQDSQGNILWAKNFNQTDNVYVEKIITDASDNVYITGGFKDTIDFGDNVFTNSDTKSDFFVVKLDPLGQTIWAKHFEIIFSASLDSNVRDFTIDETGNIYLTGDFHGILKAGITTLTASNTNVRNVFIIKIDDFGNTLWMKSLDDNGKLFSRNIYADTSKDIYITGTIDDDIWFDDIFLPRCDGNTICSFLLKINDLGVAEWVEKYGGSLGSVSIRNIETDINGDLLVLGLFDSVAVFGNTTLASFGDSDVFLLKLSEDLSIKNNKTENWSVYPNPTKDFITLNFPNHNSTKLSVDVFNMLGQKLKVFENLSNSENIDLSELSSGIYLLKINYNGINQTIKIKKQ